MIEILLRRELRGRGARQEGWPHGIRPVGREWDGWPPYWWASFEARVAAAPPYRRNQ